MRFRLTQVQKGKNVSHLCGRASAVGQPYLHLGDLDGGLNHWQGFQPILIVITKIMRHEKVPVGLVIVCFNAEFLRGSPALNIQTLPLASLLSHDRGDRGIAKLEFAFETKQALRARD